MAESLLTGLVFIFRCAIVGRNFVIGICKLKPKNLKRNWKRFCFFQPCWLLTDRMRLYPRTPIPIPTGFC